MIGWNRFTSLAVGKKLAASYAIIACLLITVAAVSVSALNDYNHRIQILDKINTAELSLLKAEISEKDFRIHRESHYIDRASEQVGKSISALKQLLEIIESKEDRQLVEETLADAEAYQNLVQEYEANISAQPDVVSAIEQEMLAKASHAINLAEQLKDREQTLLNETYDLTLAEILTMSGIALLLAVAIAWTLTHSMTKPINRSVEIASSVASGDLTVDASSQRGDEFGALLAAFGTMITGLRDLVGQIDSGATSIASSSEELSAVTNQTSDGVAEQKSQTDQVATAMNEMVATVAEIARSAEAAFQAANHASEKSVHGQKAVNETLAFVTDMNDQSAKVADQLSQLQSETQNIVTVLDVIKSVAEQTNLLALNAAIEAARAGEQGRGFAVVADEVRSLAQRTQSSAGEIENLISNLLSSAENSVASMDSGRKLATQSLERAELAGTAIAEMAEAVEEIRQYNSQIATAAEQQSSVAEDINRNVTEIRDLGDQSATSSEQVSSASEELARLAATLSSQVSRFRIA